jgi:hypothetical protein
MAGQVAVNSIESLSDLRVALALFGEDALGALGAIGAEVRRTMFWLQHDRPMYWQEQIKRAHERLASAKAELFRRQLAKSSGSSAFMTEQQENVKLAAARLQECEQRLILTKKWQTQLHQAVLEYYGTVRRIKALAAGDVPSAINLLTRLIDSLEEYLKLAPPTTSGTTEPAKSAPPEFEAIAVKMIEAEPPAPVETAEDEPEEIVFDKDEEPS